MEQDKIYILKLSQMTVTVWIIDYIVLNWARYNKNDIDHIRLINKHLKVREPGDLDYIQVNMTIEEYKQLKLK